jgi:hypothetical protein
MNAGLLSSFRGAHRTSALQSGCLADLTKPVSAKSLTGPLKQASVF